MSDTATLSKRAQFGIPLSYGFFVLFGAFGGGLLPTLNKSLQDTFSLSNTELGYLISAAALLGVTSNLLGGHLTDRLGALRTLILACLSLPLCLVFLWVQRDATLFFLGYYLFVALLGLTVATNALGASLFGDKQTERMNTLHGCQGIGRILSPLILAAILGLGFAWFDIFLLGALGHLLFLALFLRLRAYSSTSQSVTHHGNSFATVRSDPKLWVGLFAFFFCTSTEAIFMNWIPVFFEGEVAYSKFHSLLCFSSMMVGYTVVRFAPLWFGMRTTPHFFFLTIFLQLLTCVVLFFHPPLLVGMLMGTLLGFSFGIYWPAQLVTVYELVPSSAHGTVAGIAVTLSATGVFLLNGFFGYLADLNSIGTMLLFMPLCSLIFVWLHEHSKRS